MADDVTTHHKRCTVFEAAVCVIPCTLLCSPVGTPLPGSWAQRPELTGRQPAPHPPHLPRWSSPSAAEHREEEGVNAAHTPNWRADWSLNRLVN